MAAGLGFKTFATGEVLTAGDVNGYLMQGILVFASTAARDAAITSPQEGQFAFTKDTNSLWYYDGSAWVASGAAGDIEGVTAGVGISGGGTSGTVTVTNSMATAIDAKGDLVVGTGADTFSRLAVGANGTTLVADSAEATGLKWATPASSGGMTLLSTTTLTGTSVNLTSISGAYKKLYGIVYGYTNTGSNDYFVCNPNSASTVKSASFAGATSTVYYTNAIPLSYPANPYQVDKTVANNVSWFEIQNYASTTTFKPITSGGYYTSMVPEVTVWFSSATFPTNTAITSLLFSNTGGGSFTSGTILLYGVN